MKITGKIVCALVSFALLFGGLFGCNREPGVAVNKDKTQLNIGVFDGGLGGDWIYEIKDDFEKKYENIEFEPGKKGVQLRVSPSRTFTQTGLEQNIDSVNEDIVFAEGANSQYFAAGNKLMDISDVVTRPLSYDFITGQNDPTVENVSIEFKLSQSQRDYFSSVGGKYYALPTAETYYCIVYDIELFEENNLFFRSDGSFVTGPSDARSPGPDGKAETEYDNGLPATYEQFFRLCQKIVDLNKNLIPVMWGGSVQEYVSSFLLALAADYAGVEQTELNYNYSGTMTEYISSFDASGSPVISTDPVAITAANGYELYRQPGRYYALSFLEQLTGNPAYYNNKTATTGSFTHQDAQGQFVMAKYRTSMQRAAMLIDGNWWQSEAKGVFNELVAEKGEEASAQNRKFGIMPLPKYSNTPGEYTLLQNTGYVTFVNPRVADYKVNLVKEFLQYCYTDKALAAYTKTTSICRPVAYDMGDSYNELSSWGKYMVDLHQNAQFAYQDSSSKIMQNYSVDLWYSPRLWYSVTNGKTYTYPSTAMINDSVSAKDYFEGLESYWTPSVWKNKFQNV